MMIVIIIFNNLVVLITENQTRFDEDETKNKFYSFERQSSRNFDFHQKVAVKNEQSSQSYSDELFIFSVKQFHD